MDGRPCRDGELWPVVPDDCTTLFERERLPMLRLATLLVGSAEVGEEVVQDAFASVVERWGSSDNPGGYLRTCVVNRSRTVLRRRAVEQRVVREHSLRAVEQPMALTGFGLWRKWDLMNRERRGDGRPRLMGT